MSTLAIGFVLALVSAWVLTAVVVRIARRAALFDRDEGRGAVAYRCVPRVGGIAIAASFLLACAYMGHGENGVYGLFSRWQIEVAAAVTFGVGLFDDLSGVSAKLKLVTLLVAGALVAQSGLAVERVPFWGAVAGSPSSIAVTAVWFAVVGTAWNFIDGLDGLAASFTSVVSIAVFVISSTKGLVQPMCPALAGAALGFLAHNRHPARIFMGDGGSFFLGFWVAVLTLNVTAQTGSPWRGVILLLAWPLADLSWAFTHRAMRRQLFRAGRDHLHYVLHSRVGHRAAVLAALAISGLASTAAVWSTAGALPALAMGTAVVIVGAFVARMALRRLSAAAATAVVVVVLAAVPSTWTRSIWDSVLGSARPHGGQALVASSDDGHRAIFKFQSQ